MLENCGNDDGRMALSFEVAGKDNSVSTDRLDHRPPSPSASVAAGQCIKEVGDAPRSTLPL